MTGSGSVSRKRSAPSANFSWPEDPDAPLRNARKKARIEAKQGQLGDLAPRDVAASSSSMARDTGVSEPAGSSRPPRSATLPARGGHSGPSAAKEAPGPAAAGQASLPPHKKLPHLGELIKRGSQAGTPRPKNNLIGAFQVAAEKAPYSSSSILCTELAMGYLIHPHFLDEVVNDDKLQEHFDADDHFRAARDLMSEALRQKESTRQVVSNEGFGNYLADATDLMIHSSLDSARFAITTSDHVLAMKIRRKTENGVDRVVVSGFDPNTTTNHFKVQVEVELAAHELSSLTAQDLFPSMPQYILDDTGLSAPVTVLAVDGLEVAPAGSLKFLPTDGLAAGIEIDLNGLALAAMKNNLPTVLNEFPLPPVLPGDPVPQWLECRVDARTPGLHIAAYQDHGEPVLAYAHLLHRAQVDVQSTGFQLIEGLDVDQVPALFAAAAEDNAGNFARGFAMAIKALGFDEASITHLMSARNADGIPALSYAIEQGHYGFVDAFVDSLETLGITGELAGRLLESKALDGTPPLKYAYEENDGEMIRKISLACQRLGVPESQQRSILAAATEPQGDDGPATAQEEGNTDALAAYQEAASRWGAASSSAV